MFVGLYALRSQQHAHSVHVNRLLGDDDACPRVRTTRRGLEPHGILLGRVATLENNNSINLSAVIIF